MVTIAPTRQQAQVCIGKAGLPVGSLTYVRQGRRENCAFAYDEAWLANPARFNVSADLQLVPGHQSHKAASAHDSVFHGAIADTAPDAWGRRVIARDHAKRRKSFAASTAMRTMVGFPTSRQPRCCRPHGKKTAATPRSQTRSARTAMPRPRMYASSGGAWCSTC